MIYCVVPEPLADELFPKLEAYYADDANVTVIVDRRKSSRRVGEERRGEGRNGDSALATGRREVRDRRRARAAGDFPRIDPSTE